MNIILNNETLDNFTLINHDYLVDTNFYDNVSGVNEYRLYSYLSTLFSDIVIMDIGTYNGRSAVALSHNIDNKVISYNINDQINNATHKIYTKSNIEFKVKNVMHDLSVKFLEKVKIIVIDIDHFYTNEIELINKLQELNYNGLIILDDIHHPSPKENECMQKLWNCIDAPKIDITKYGHSSGTGLINLSDNIHILSN